MDESDEQLRGLQKACAEHEALALIMTIFAMYKNAVREVNVDGIWKKAKAKRRTIKRSEIVAGLKKLDELEFGTYTKGAHGYASRFVFAHLQGPLRLAMMAQGEVQEDDLPDDFEPEDVEVALAEAVADSGFAEDDETVTHFFRLRQDLRIDLKLPADLSANEGKRLSLWVRSLSLDSEGDEI